MFTYCVNNPVMYMDYSGHSWSSFWGGVGDWFKDNWQWVVGGVIIAATIFIPGLNAFIVPTLFGAGLGLIGGGITISDGSIDWDWNEAKKGFLEGSITGLISGVFGKYFSGSSFGKFKVLSRVLFGIISSSVVSIGSDMVKREKISLPAAITSVVVGGLLGFIPGSQRWVSSVSSGLGDIAEKIWEEIIDFFKNKNK